MEAILTSGGEDHLIEGLSFKPPSNTANYVLETRQVTYQAESGNSFDPVSSRVIRFRLVDHGFFGSIKCKVGPYVAKQGGPNYHAHWPAHGTVSTSEAICIEPTH